MKLRNYKKDQIPLSNRYEIFNKLSLKRSPPVFDSLDNYLHIPLLTISHIYKYVSHDENIVIYNL